MALASGASRIRFLNRIDVLKGLTSSGPRRLGAAAPATACCSAAAGPPVNSYRSVQIRFLRHCRKLSTHPADKTLTDICRKEKISHSSSSSSSSSDNEFDENGRLKRCLFPDSCKVYYQFAHVTVEYVRGLPQVTVPLPSRREKCKFTLKPITNDVGDLISMLKTEDKGIDRVVALSMDDTRIAASNSIEHLLEEDFKLVINDSTYIVRSPKQTRITGEEAKRLDDIKTLVSQLYEALNVQEHNVMMEKDLQAKLEMLQQELMPLEEQMRLHKRQMAGPNVALSHWASVYGFRNFLQSSSSSSSASSSTKNHLDMIAQRKSDWMAWIGLGLMSVQFGILARLTWWEYSWDIMEPVTYFVTYGTAMAGYAYFVLTKQEYVLKDVKDRQQLLTIHKKAKKAGLDLQKYNLLKEEINLLEKDLYRLQHPLKLHLPQKQIESKEAKSTANAQKQ